MRAWLHALLLTMLVGTAAANTSCPEAVNITVIYNCMIWPDQDWKMIITQQLQDLVSIGLDECARIHVVMSVPTTHSQLAYDQLEHLLLEGRQVVASVLHIQHQPDRIGGTVVSQVHENSFEYPGLHLLWLLAQVRLRGT